MIFDGKPASEITTEDILAVVSNCVAEDQYVDFKACPYQPDDNGTSELIKDITAFANSAGGYLLIGIREDGQGNANAIVPIENAERIRRSIIDKSLVRIEPRLPNLDTRIISTSKGDVIVCRVPESPLKPHIALPNRERHYFWKQYSDGNKLMTHAEIREQFLNDSVLRELSMLRQDIQSTQQNQVVIDEQVAVVDEGNLLTLTTPEAIFSHTSRHFSQSMANTGYYRLSAMPTTTPFRDIRNERVRILSTFSKASSYRSHGFDVRNAAGLQELAHTAVGVETSRGSRSFFRLMWNGFLEFGTLVDDNLTWGMQEDGPKQQKRINPLALVEYTPSFVRLAADIWRSIDFDGPTTFRSELCNAKDRRLYPYALKSYGQVLGAVGGASTGIILEDAIKAGPICSTVADLPGTVAYQLISEVYYRVGYSREQMPYFDESDRCVFDIEYDRDGRVSSV